MRNFLFILAMALVPVQASSADQAALEAMRDGHMKKLVFSAPKAAPETPFFDLEGGEFRLSDWQGKIVLVNFWATWCAPCRKEMPSLDRLQAELGGDDFEVLTIATGRNSPQGMRRFFEDEGISNLPLMQDPKQALARNMSVLGLPISVVLDREGREIARLRGDAEWDTDSALAILKALVESPNDS